MRIIIADDHPLFRESLHLLLREMCNEVEFLEASSFDEVFTHVNHPGESVDVVLLDLDMPGMDWRQAVVQLVAKGLAVVVISATMAPDVIKESMAMGASGFIPKNLSGKVMRGALQLVLSGGTYLPSAILMRHSPPKPFPHPLYGGIAAGRELNEARYPLTKRQSDVLSRLAEGQSNKEIARDLDLSEGTVKLHVTAILKSFGAHNRTQAVMMARQSGTLVDGGG